MTMNEILSRAPVCASIPNSPNNSSGDSSGVFCIHSAAVCAKTKADLPVVLGSVLASLGTTAKYAAISETIDTDTGEITQTEQPFSPMDSRIQRFALQSVSRKFLPKSRTAVCMRWRQKGKDVEVWQSKEFK